MSAQQHRIKQVTFELEVAHAALGAQIHDGVSRFHSNNLADTLDTGLSRLTRDDELLRIDKLELDLGHIAAATFEEGLVARFEESLYSALHVYVGGADQYRLRARAESARELLSGYAATGLLPWWADATDQGLLPTALTSVLETDDPDAPVTARAFLCGLLQYPQGEQRIVRAFDDTLLTHLANHINTREVGDLTRSVSDLVSLIEVWFAASTQRRTEAPTRVSLRANVWQAVLHVTANTRGLATADFWRAVVGLLGTRFGVAAGVFVSELNRHIQRMGMRTTAALRQAITVGDRSLQPPSAAEADVTFSVQQDNELPFATQADAIRRLEALRDHAEAFDPSELREVVSNLLRSPLPTTLLRRLLLTYADVFEPLLKKAELDAMLDARVEQASIPIHRDLAAVDAAYVENAGLVLLAGFLPRFFERLGLLDDGGMLTAAGRTRGVSLLQYLASGDKAVAPEFLLPLNKVLCGLAPLDLITIDQPVRESDVDEADLLLRAVIEHAPILNKMSSDGFRGSFLLRKGVLESADGTWLMRVERKTYDIVLDQLPWNFTWIRTPWMPTTLRVEW